MYKNAHFQVMIDSRLTKSHLIFILKATFTKIPQKSHQRHSVSHLFPKGPSAVLHWRHRRIRQRLSLRTWNLNLSPAHLFARFYRSISFDVNSAWGLTLDIQTETLERLTFENVPLFQLLRRRSLAQASGWKKSIHGQHIISKTALHRYRLK